MITKCVERCWILRADCRNNDDFICDYLYVCNIREQFKSEEIRYYTTPNVMYADKLHYEPENICDYINKDMQNYEEKLKFEMVLVEFTTIVEEVKDKGE